MISGGTGNDWLFGNKGNDHLIGGDGYDICRGLKGDDLIESCSNANPVNFIANGSFEEGLDPGNFVTKAAGGDSGIDSWLITLETIDYIGTLWTASDGVRSLDMNGNTGGAISQTFPTVEGHRYKVTFDAAANPFVTMTLQVSVAGKTKDFVLEATGIPEEFPIWVEQSLTFIAGASTSFSTLTITSLGTGPGGPALDNVKVVDSGG